ncbi:MAG: UvrD-helicase domain-containing protein [Armatimonadetes bacterium]|nr:UvrD-helicase domain-containing protein [Armatimonadota bacterium]
MPRALTPEQQAVVDWPGSAAVTAGAGTGKTELMAERFAAHLLRDGFRPLQVVAVTFTDAAAAELRSRIRRNLQARAAGLEEQLAELEAAPIGTLHSLCKRVCDEHPTHAEVAPGSRVLDEGEAAAWIAEQLDDALSTTDAAHFGRDGVPFSLAREALRAFLGDPLTADLALRQVPDGLDEWLARCQTLFT